MSRKRHTLDDRQTSSAGPLAPPFVEPTSSAVLSEDGRYRYRLTRTWGEGRPVVFVMLNPSTADASADDPTIRRCIGFAKAWGFNGIEVVNLFALRSTDPAALATAADPIGPDNDRHLREAVTGAPRVVVAWGNDGELMGRGAAVLSMLAEVGPFDGASACCLGVNKSGHPKHPLYVSGLSGLLPAPPLVAHAAEAPKAKRKRAKKGEPPLVLPGQLELQERPSPLPPAAETTPPATVVEAPATIGLVGNASVRIDGERAHLELPDFSLASYRTWIDVKSAVPRVEVEGRIISFPAADLSKLGLRAASRVLLGYEDDGSPLFADQRYVLDVALRRRRFAVFAECGWGKTLVQLAWARQVAARTGRKVLLVAPLKVIRGTIEEHRKFYPGQEVPLSLHGREGGIEAWLADPAAPRIAIVNLDVFRTARDLTGLGGLSLDESSCLKQASGIIRNNLVKAALPVEYLLCSSATPAPNDLEEYVSHALFLRAVLTHKEFFAGYFSSDGEGGWRLRPYAKEAFYAFMASWSIWIRDPASYGFDARFASIPDPIFRDVFVETTPEQERESKAFRKKGVLFLGEEGAVGRGKLAQISRGFLYEKHGKTTTARAIPSLKPAAVADAVAAHPGERAVVWATYNEEAQLLLETLRARGLRTEEVSGETSEDRTWELVSALNAGTIDTLVAKPAALGFGVNLQGASVCVFSGISDSFERDYQALRRLHRFGQTRAVTCYYVATDFERPMLDNVARKRNAWAEQATAMELAYLAAASADLSIYRGERDADSHRTRAALASADLRVLATATPWKKAV